jgi:enoyl-CoA hydratase/carnithine racemase
VGTARDADLTAPVEWSERDRVAVVMLNRPRVLNALNRAVLARLDDILQEIGRHEDTYRVVLLTGAGGNFSAGDDLKEAAALTREERYAALDAFQALTLRVLDLPQPVIAVLDGWVVGGALELSLACDMRIASERARFFTPEVTRGLLISNASSVLLPLVVGPGRAREMVYGGRVYDAAWAYEAGLVNAVLPAEKLMEDAMARGREIARQAADAVRAAKRLFIAPMRPTVVTALENERREGRALADSPALKEGLEAFLDRRPGEFD